MLRVKYLLLACAKIKFFQVYMFKECVLDRTDRHGISV